MPIIAKKFNVKEQNVDKSKFGGIEKCVIVQNTSHPNVPQVSMWLKDQSYFFLDYFDSMIQKLYNFKVRKDDIWVVTFPKTGTTWVQEMVWLINNNLDYKTAQSIHLTKRFPHFHEYVCVIIIT